MLAGIYWRGPNFSLMEALMALDQAKITHILGPPMSQHNAIILALVIHAYVHQASL